MKKINVLSLAALALSLGFSSCDLDAPTKSATDAQTVFTTPAMAETAIMGIHVSFCETNSYRGRFLPYYGLNTDCEWINGCNKYTEEKYQLCQYSTLSNNSQMNTDNNAYGKFYEGIERANQAIDGLRRYSDQSNEFYRQLLGEALTLRAVIYNDLIRAWGDVPARFTPITSETLYLPRTDRDILYKQLLADLLEAEDLCAWPNESSATRSTERVSKAFVKGLRARIALFAGGYSYRADGTMRLSKDPELAPEKMYALAAQECEDIIAKGCNKLGSFEENFRALCEESTAAGKESIYELPFSDGRGRVLYTFGIKHAKSDQYTDQAQGGVNGPLPNLFYDYNVNDVRRDITCIPYSWSDPTKTQGGIAIQEVGVSTKGNRWNFGKLRYEWMNRKVTSTNDDGINWQFMRYADILMMAAEAENQLGNTAKAWGFLKPVLDRALPASDVAALQTKYTASKDAFQLGIEEQRKFEFAGEMLRKSDLIRWNKLTAYLGEAKERLDALYTQGSGVSFSGAYDYSDLPTKIYYINKLDSKGNPSEKITIFGLNHGETDDEGKDLVENDGYTAYSWLGSSSASDYNVYLYNPEITPLEKGSLWPIWDVFVNNSNNMLTTTSQEALAAGLLISEY